METKDLLFEKIKNHKIFSEDIQKKVGRDRSVVYAVDFLQKYNIDATFQRICIVCFKLFPESFSFSEFLQYPDSRSIRNCLWHCVHKSKGWLIGSDKTKYNVTEKGKEIVDIFVKILDKGADIDSLPFSLKIRGKSRKDYTTKQPDKEVQYITEIKHSIAFKLFKEKNTEIKSLDIKKSLGGDRYSPWTYLYNKLLQGIKDSEIANDNEVKQYLYWLKDNWTKLIGK